jgi:TonB-linked SusC/RagA family outer membrane protein
MRRLLFVLGFICLAQLIYAQNRTIKGVISEVNGAPISGATIVATGTSARTTSAGDGQFLFSVPSTTRTLTVSSVGFATQTVELGASSTINVSLVVSTGELQAVVVTGYGSVDRSKYSGAASKVSEVAIRNVPMGSFDQILQGKAPGLSVLSGSGQPGDGDASMVVRGPTSIQGGNDPLYIIDGIPVEAGAFQGINANDIASVDVLKDASAAALYGSRGAAGVIVVTTKRGKSGKIRIGVSSQFGVKSRPEFGYTPMTTDQLLAAQEKLGKLLPGTMTEWGTFPIIPGWQYASSNPNKLVGGVTTPKTAGDLAFGARQLDSLRGISTDWYDEFFDQGKFSNNEISFSGGEGRTRLYSNLGYYQEEGILRPTDMKRISLRTNADYKDEKLTLAISTIASYTRRNLEANPLNGFNSFINPFGVPQLTPQYLTPKLPNGQYNTGQALAFFAPNMLDKIVYDKVYNNQVKAVLSISLNYDFTRTVYAGAVAGVDFRETNNSGYDDPRTFTARTAASIRTRSGSMSEALTRFVQPTARAYVGYRNNFGADHSVDATVYGEVIRTYSKSFSATGFGIDTLRPNTIAAVTAGNAANQLFQSVSGGRSQRAINSVFGILRYTFKEKYTLTGSYRYDGASNLPEQNRFDGFFSVGAVWDVMRENFMSRMKAINTLRVKFSFGEAANNENFPQGDFGYLALYNTNTSLPSGLTGISPLSPGNPDAEWEYTTTTNLGVDFGFLQNRLYGDLQFYHKKTNNLYVGLVLPAASGFGYAQQDINAGAMSNKGIEYSLNYDLVKSKNVGVTISANGAYNKNEVTDLGKAKSYELGTSLVSVGSPLSSHYYVKWGGVDAVTGAPLFYTKDGKLTKTFSAEDRVQEFGSSIPTLTGGFGTTIRFHAFEATAFFNYANNMTRVNNMEFFIQNPNFLQQGVNQDAGYSFWTKPGDVADLQSPLYQTQATSRGVQDASWLRLRTLQLNYTVPSNVLAKTGFFSEARIYVLAQNLFTWSKWRGLDPEDNNNISGTEYPNPRAITAGIDIRF